jgi:hypothetical protein
MTYNFAKAVLSAWRNGSPITYAEAHEAALKGLESGEFKQSRSWKAPVI